MGITLNIVTYRDIFQYEAGKKSRFSPEFQKLSAEVLMDKQDMAKLGVNDGQNVCLENDVGRVVVAARQTEDDPHPGLAFMTNSPWSNQLVKDDVCETGIPGFKCISINACASNEELTKVSELLQRMRG